MTTVSNAYRALIDAGEITADPAQEAVLPFFDRIDQDLAAPLPQARGFFRRAAPPPAIKGLYLWGGVGRGKSMLMDLFHEVSHGPKRRVHFHAFMQEVHRGMHEVRKTGVDDALAPVAEKIAADVRLFCFDEMQITDITDAMIVGRLFEHLFEAGVAVVTTSNRPPEDLYKDGLNRALFLPFIDLLNDKMDVHELASPKDYRQNRLEGSPVYFTPADQAARKAIDALWAELGGAAAAPLTLTVQGRAVEIPAFHNGVARVGFSDLCGRPLGPADYLALTQTARVLIIEDIPRLSRHNFNEAKRFVTLIDAVYEAKTRLIASAAAAPETLYVEGEGSFEFERTASRLREMQSEDWATDGA